MHTDSSDQGPGGGVDRLSGLLDRFAVRATLIEAEPLRFARLYGDGGVAPGGGHLHVIRSGVVEVVHPVGRPEPARARIDEPTLLLYPAPAPHRLIPLEPADVTCAALTFDEGGRHPLVRALPPYVAVPIADVPGLGPALDLLGSEIEQVRCGRRLLAGRLLDVVLVQLLRWLLDHPGHAAITDGLIAGMAHPGLAAALTAVHDDPGAPWTIERLATRAAMSRSAFAAAFRDVLGEGPAAYVAGYRIAIAQQRLLAGEPVVAFAGELGYANASGFSRAFTARVGRSPTAWLAQRRTEPGPTIPTAQAAQVIP